MVLPEMIPAASILFLYCILGDGPVPTCRNAPRHCRVAPANTVPVPMGNMPLLPSCLWYSCLTQCS
eukprot:4054834-Pleurochrysis_carterae.AAC.1